MAVMLLTPLFLLFFFFSLLPLSSSQLNSPLNIETFFPTGSPHTISTLGSPNNPPISPSLTPLIPPPSPSPSPSSQAPSASGRTVGKVVAATTVSTLVVAGVFFFFIQRYTKARRRRGVGKTQNVFHRDQAVGNELRRFDGTLKGLIVDERGLDVLYWRKLEGGQLKNSFCKEVLNVHNEGEEQVARRGDRRTKSEPIQEIPLLRGRSSNSSSRIRPEGQDPRRSIAPPPPPDEAIAKLSSSIPPSPPPPGPAPPIQPPRPPPPAAIPAKKSPPTPPPPPLPVKKNPTPPPPLRDSGGLASSSKPPPAPRGNPNSSKRAEASSGERSTGKGTTKLKPLHWDKVTANVDHSMVWDKIGDGSFRFDDDLIEALFSYGATNTKSPERNEASTNLNIPNSGPSAQIFILDPRKSQNTAIVLRSLAVSRQEILDALLEGGGLDADTLEKLTKTAPTKEEEDQILGFNGDPAKLTDAESFLFQILKSVPSAFTRLDAMLFKLNYDHEILQLKESLQTLELGCKELRTRGLFLKLLEAILKAGNRMNAGTARGNAQAFNLTALRKVSDVKSTDGKMTLLHFVVEEVVRSEGKRCVINRNHSLSRSSTNSGLNSDGGATAKEEREKEYIMLGLPVIGGLSVQFSNVKKAATVDYDALVNTCSALTARVAQIRQLLVGSSVRGEGAFVREMKGFLEAAEEELKVVGEEQTRVMELVKRTTEYYQAGSSKDKAAHPLQLFVIVKDFLCMVDQVCVDIARKKQQQKKSSGSSPPLSPEKQITVKFPNLPAHFMSNKLRTSSSSDSEDDF